MVRIQYLAVSITLLAACANPRASAQTLAPEFQRDYSFVNLGQVAGLPLRQGGLIMDRTNADRLLIGGAANTENGKLYSVAVTRDASHSIARLGRAEMIAQLPYNDGGMVYAANGILLAAQWPVNRLAQLKPGSNKPDRVLTLGPSSRTNSLASIQFYPPSGRLKMLAWSSGLWGDAEAVLERDGTYKLQDIRRLTRLPGGPEGFVYVPKGSPRFDKPSILVAEWSDGNIAAYEVNENGDPIPSTRRVFVSGLKGAEGGMIDPQTGDYLFTTFGGGDRIIRVDGLKRPDPRQIITANSRTDGGASKRVTVGTPPGMSKPKTAKPTPAAKVEKSKKPTKPPEEMRDLKTKTAWRLADGKISFGRFLLASKQFKNVILRGDDGKLLRIPLEKLHAREKELLKDEFK